MPALGFAARLSGRYYFFKITFTGIIRHYLLEIIKSHLSSIDTKLSVLDKVDLSDIESHLSSIDSKLSDLSSLESRLSSIDTEVNQIGSSSCKTDLFDIESDLMSIKQELDSSLGESIKDKLDKIIFKLEELIEKR